MYLKPIHNDDDYAAALQAIDRLWDAADGTRKDLEPYIGSRGRVSEIMGRKRPLTITMIRNLEQATGIPASILIQPYATAHRHGNDPTANAPVGARRAPVA